MKQALQILGISLLMFSACSEPLDASKIEKEKISLKEFNTPVEVFVPKGAKASEAAEPEDMLGLFTIYTTKVEAENFAIEVICTTEEGMLASEVFKEKSNEIKSSTGFSKVIEEVENGMLYESKEINDDLNYNFIKVFSYDESYTIVVSKPKPDGNTTLEEAKYMFDIINNK